MTESWVTRAPCPGPRSSRLGLALVVIASAQLMVVLDKTLSRLTEHATYPGQLLGPMLVTSSGLGLLFVPLALVAPHNVAEHDAGVAASLLNTGQQVGGAIGLAALGTIAWTTVAASRPRCLPG
jgi:hypothetical protein